MKCAKDFRNEARAALSGHWPSAVLAGIIAAVLGGGIIYSTGGASAASSGSETALENSFINLEALPPIVFTVISVFAVLVVILAVISIVIGGAVSLGYAKYNLSLIDRKPANAEDLISQFNRLGDGFVMRLLSGIYIFLWSLLLIVPGVIASFSYSMAPYILYENPGMSASEAITASKELMRGNKWRLFCLELSFFGWSLLAALTLGIGGLFLRPYVEAAGAAFYREIKAEKPPAQESVYGEYTVV